MGDWDTLLAKVDKKMDGANAGISFDESGKLHLQSRGHYLRGGPRERHFDRFKQWASARQEELFFILGTRYVMYGEWLLAKHTYFYDALPHYFMEFDVYDTKDNVFLSTEARQQLIVTATVPQHVIVPVLVLTQGRFDRLDDLAAHLGPSRFITDDRFSNLTDAALDAGVLPIHAHQHTDMDPNMEGLYVKWEEDGIVKGRYKFVRQSFTNSIMDQDDHWLNRPIIRNKLAPGAEEMMFA